MDAYVDLKCEKLRTLTMLVRHATLHRRAVNAKSLGNLKAEVAIERVIAYANECLACEVHKQPDKPFPDFAGDIQAQFAYIGEMIDCHLAPGAEEMERRRGLLRRAFTFCQWLPHLDDQPDAIDYEAVADALNEREARRELYKFLFRRDIGEFGPVPTYTGGMDEDFTAAQAFEFIGGLERLHRLLDARVRSGGPIFVNQKLGDEPLHSATSFIDARPPPRASTHARSSFIT